MLSPARSSSASATRPRARSWISWFGTASNGTHTWEKRKSMVDDLSDLYQQVILDHCKQPRNFHEMGAATCSAQGHNPLCGDQLKLFLALEGETIKDISFVGSGCCISKASASLLTETLKGKRKGEVQPIFDKVHKMVTTGEVESGVGKLTVFAGVHKFPARV